MSVFKKGTPIIKPTDTPAMIKHCLECPWTECWNCLGRNNAYSNALKVDLGYPIKYLDKKMWEDLVNQ